MTVARAQANPAFITDLFYTAEDGVREADCCREDRDQSPFYFWKRCGFYLTENSRFAVSKTRLFALQETLKGSGVYDARGKSGAILGTYIGTLCQQFDSLCRTTKYGGRGIQIQRAGGSVEDLLDDHDNDPWLDNGAPNQHRDAFIAVALLANILGGEGDAFIIDEFWGDLNHDQALAPTPMPGVRAIPRTAPPGVGSPGGGGNMGAALLLLVYALQAGFEPANDGPIVVSPPPVKLPMGFAFSYDPDDLNSLADLFSAHQRWRLSQQGWLIPRNKIRERSEVLLKGGGAENGVPKYRTQKRKTPAERIDARKKSNDPGEVFEGEEAEKLWKKGYVEDAHILVGFENSPLEGEIDVVTRSGANPHGQRYLVEITDRSRGKSPAKIAKLLFNLILNPDQLPVILYAPYYSDRATEALHRRYGDWGFRVCRNFDDLCRTIASGTLRRQNPVHQPYKKR